MRLDYEDVPLPTDFTLKAVRDDALTTMAIDWSEVLPPNAKCTHDMIVLAGKQSKGSIASFVVGTICVSIEHFRSYVVSTFSKKDGHLIKQTEWQTPLAAIYDAISEVKRWSWPAT